MRQSLREYMHRRILWKIIDFFSKIFILSHIYLVFIFMKNTCIVPLVFLSSITSLTSCSLWTEKVDTLPPVVSAASTGDVLPVIPVSIDVLTGKVLREPGLIPAVRTWAQGSGATPSPAVPPSTVESGPVTRTGIESYQSPAGTDQVEFSVTVDDKWVITAASAKVMATNDASKYNQENFAKQVSEKVVGKAKKDFTLDTVAGASLTTASFNKYIQTL